MKIQYVSKYIALSEEGLVSKMVCPEDQGLLFCNMDENDKVFLYCLECNYTRDIGYESYDKIKREVDNAMLGK